MFHAKFCIRRLLFQPQALIHLILHVLRITFHNDEMRPIDREGIRTTKIDSLNPYSNPPQFKPVRSLLSGPLFTHRRWTIGDGTS